MRGMNELEFRRHISEFLKSVRDQINELAEKLEISDPRFRKVLAYSHVIEELLSKEFNLAESVMILEMVKFRMQFEAFMNSIKPMYVMVPVNCSRLPPRIGG